GKFWVGSYAGTTVLDRKGKPNQVVLIIRDITERQYMEQALRISEERLRFAVEGAEIGIWQWDIYTDEMRFSSRCRLIFGIEPDSELGYEAFIERLHPEDRERTRTAMADAIGDKTECHLEFRVLRPDGDLYWIASRASGFYDAEGIPLRMEGIASEMVERRRPEGEIPSLGAANLPERRPPDEAQ
ncbi:MAG: PAS domain-containing protein, partial [Armatimonadota bacterium]|nr:PAS domain-containing protein [Armatimonadota bacterium]